MSIIYLFKASDPMLASDVINGDKELDTFLSFFGYNTANIMNNLPYVIAEGTISKAKFQVGDRVKLLSGISGEVKGYLLTMGLFQVRVEAFHMTTTFYEYEEDIEFLKEDSETTIKFEVKKEDSHVCCSIYNKECKIVESYTGIGSHLGDKFLYCRTHKLEVPPLSLPNKKIDDWGY